MSIHPDKLEKEAAADFWKWVIRVAKPEVIDAADAIECHGFADENGLVPVMSLNDLVEKWYDKYIWDETK